MSDINNRLQHLKDEEQFNYNSEISQPKISEIKSPEKTLGVTGRGGGAIKETRNEL